MFKKKKLLKMTEIKGNRSKWHDITGQHRTRKVGASPLLIKNHSSDKVMRAKTE